AHPYTFQRTAAGGRRLALSGAAEDAAQGLGESRVGHFRNQPQSEILQTHGRGQETTASGNRGLWTRGAGDRISDVQSVKEDCQNCQDCQRWPKVETGSIPAIFGNLDNVGNQRGFYGRVFSTRILPAEPSQAGTGAAKRDRRSSRDAVRGGAQ